jgi:glycosyltransferase involved in cell wall biosynthesis
MNFSWNVIRARKKASVIYAFSNEDMAYLSRNTKADIRLMLDVGTYPDQFTPKDKHPKGSVVKAIWCGQLAYRKAPVILLKALAKSITTREDLQIQIIGEGPLEQELIVIANELGLKNIEWIKNVAHKEVFSLMCKADFLIHTSLREATSSVIPEALSVGLPVICHDVNGMSVAVNESCGIKVPMISPEESIDRFHDAMIRLIQDRELLNRLQLGAINRAKELSWERNAEIIANDYLRIVNSQE